MIDAMQYKNRYETYRQAVEHFLEQQLTGSPRWVDLYKAMRYSLLSGGKRIRPVMTLEFARLAGLEDWKQALPVACSLELVHTYSLIHDDLPCMDDDDLRRGKPTNHKVYGEGIAILAGDALLTAAFGQLVSAELPAEAKLRAVEVLSSCAGETGMVGGQVLDIMSEKRECTEQEILDIQSRKTGALIRSACVLGVLAGGGSTEQECAAADFAEHLGLAFQIRDDMLDVIGDEKTLGKGVHTDETKNTFVRLYGLEKCEELVKEHTEAAVRALDAFEHTEFMEQLARSLTERNF